MSALADELVLLAYRDDGELIPEAGYLDLGLAGAHLADLALHGKIVMREGTVVALDPTPTGLTVVDEVLNQIVASKPRSPGDWIRVLGVPGTRQAVLTGLVDAGVMERQRGRALLIFPKTRYPTPRGTEAAPETELRRRLHNAITSNEPVAPGTAAICGLIGVLRWEQSIFWGLPPTQVMTRLAEINRADWGAEAVQETIDQIQQAIGVIAAVAVISFVTEQND